VSVGGMAESARSSADVTPTRCVKSRSICCAVGDNAVGVEPAQGETREHSEAGQWGHSCVEGLVHVRDPPAEDTYWRFMPCPA
jgi:hypothetical protein